MLLILRQSFSQKLFSVTFQRLSLTLSQKRLSTTLTSRRMIPPANDSLKPDLRSMSPLSDLPEDILVAKPKRQPRKRKTLAVQVNPPIRIDEPVAEHTDNAQTKHRERRKSVKQPIVDELSSEEEKNRAPKRRRRKANDDDAEVEDKPKKSRRRKTPEEDKVYEIPPIENILSTTFKGRLGYACLNTMLRRYSTPIFCSRTCRLSTIAELGAQHVRSLGLQNIRDLHTLVTWNAQNGIFFMRMSSEMFPFASHPEHGYDLSYADDELKAVGKTAKELGVRLTSHPGQFTQLGSPRENVVKNAVRDLQYHCEMMDRMQLDQDSVMIIHMGGTYNDKIATLARFKENYTSLLPDTVKGRLVLENDELCYNVDDLLPICQELNIPLVFDYHHDWIYPSSRPPRDLIPEINRLWTNKGIRPKQHLSEPRPGAVTVMERRAHSDRVKRLPDDLPDDMDLMLECKDKEQAVFYLYRLYGLHDVDPRMLRPPAEVESLHTNGRKSTKRARAKAAAAAASAVAMEAEEQDVVEENGRIDEGESQSISCKVFQDEPEKGAQDNDAQMEIDEEVVRAAEEHGLAINEAVSANEGLDCGSGDEAPEVVVPSSRTRRTKKRGTRVKNTKAL